MTFTYDLASSDAQLRAIAQVRLELGDTAAGAGVRASAANLSDEEVSVWLTAEDGDPMRAVARACEMLARDWSRAANYTLGPRKEDLSDIAAAYAERAKTLRSQYGGSSSSADTLSAGVIGLDFADHFEMPESGE